MKKVVENWRIILSGDDYDAPEIRKFHLQGELAEESRMLGPYAPEEDKAIRLTSSAIVGMEKDGHKTVIVTRSGSRYYLGKPEHTGIRSLEEMMKAYPGILSMLAFPSEVVGMLAKPVSGLWVLGQLAGMSFPEVGQAYDYMRKLLRSNLSR